MKLVSITGGLFVFLLSLIALALLVRAPLASAAAGMITAFPIPTAAEMACSARQKGISR